MWWHMRRRQFSYMGGTEVSTFSYSRYAGQAIQFAAGSWFLRWTGSNGFLLLLSLGRGWKWVHLVRRPLFGPLCQPRLTDDDCGVVGMRISRGNRSSRRKPAPVPLCPPQIPNDLTWDRARAAAVGSRRLTAWAMARHRNGVTHSIILFPLHLPPPRRFVPSHSNRNLQHKIPHSSLSDI
jgi:hypothetical protein